MDIPRDDAHPRERLPAPLAMFGSFERYRIIDKKELRRYVPYSSHHVLRLEAANEFPGRLQLGPNRVGWLLGEVLDWIEVRKGARFGHAPALRLPEADISGSELNCILEKRALRRFVPYTPQHVSRLEGLGSFPVRLQLGGNRVGWLLGDILGWICERVRERDERLRLRSDQPWGEQC